jgi:septal ring factor EnvC (AmiA/AmiB activator)
MLTLCKCHCFFLFQTKLARALAEHEKEHERLQEELEAYREHAADLEDELTAQAKELEATHAQVCPRLRINEALGTNEASRTLRNAS